MRGVHVAVYDKASQPRYVQARGIGLREQAQGAGRMPRYLFLNTPARWQVLRRRAVKRILKLEGDNP